MALVGQKFDELRLDAADAVGSTVCVDLLSTCAVTVGASCPASFVTYGVTDRISERCNGAGSISAVSIVASSGVPVNACILFSFVPTSKNAPPANKPLSNDTVKLSSVVVMLSSDVGNVRAAPMLW